jgi:hypothetical protein
VLFEESGYTISSPPSTALAACSYPSAQAGLREAIRVEGYGGNACF